MPLDNPSKSFADSVNLIADLDSTYSRNVYIDKSNIQLNTQTYDSYAYLSVFNVNNIVVDTVLILNTNVVGNSGLESFLANVKSEIESRYNTIDMTYTISPNGSDYKIRIDLLSSEILIKDINLKFIINGITKYDLHSGSDNYVKILPFLSSIGADAISDMKKIAPFGNEIKQISSVASCIPVIANNISNINNVSCNINSINLVGPHASSIAYMAPFIDEIRSLSTSAPILNQLEGNMDNIICVASSVVAINVLANRTCEIQKVNDNIAQINVIANCIYPNMTAIVNAQTYALQTIAERCCVSALATNAELNACKTKEWSTSLTEVEPGLYSAKYYACSAKSYSLSPQSILDALQTVDGVGSCLDADTVRNSRPDISSSMLTLVQRSSDCSIEASYNVANGYSFKSRIRYGDIKNKEIFTAYYGSNDGILNSYNDSIPKYRICCMGGVDTILDIDPFNDVHKRAINCTGSTINMLTALEYVSADGYNITIRPFNFTTSKSTDLVGVSSNDSLNTKRVFATRQGQLRYANTTGSQFGETWSNGDRIYVKPGTTSGKLTKVVPANNEPKVFVGIVIHADALNGILDVVIDGINQNGNIDIVPLVTPSSIGAYDKAEIDTSLSAYGTISDFEGALI